MLLLLALIACPVPTDTTAVIDSTDTGAVPPPPPPPGTTWTPTIPGPFDSLCTNYPEEPQKEDPDMPSQFKIWKDAGIDEALFQHSAQVLKAKFDDQGENPPPSLETVCQTLAQNIDSGVDLLEPPVLALTPQQNQTPGTQNLIGDCPNLLPDNPVDMPGTLEDFYTFSETATHYKTYAEFPNITVYQQRLTKAMNDTEAEIDDMPGCWLQYRLKGPAAANPQINAMPVILFTMENYSTATVAFTSQGEKSVVISGAEYVLPTPVWSYLTGGAPGAASPYHVTFLLSGYPANATFGLNINSVQASVMGTVMNNVLLGAVDPFTGTGIIDPDQDEQIRELDWFIGQTVNSARISIAPEDQDLDYEAEFDRPGPGPGFPANWPDSTE